MTYTLNEADRKRLAKLCDKKYFPESIRKWNTSYERQILCEALMREGKWIEFVEYCEPHLKNYTGDIKAEIRTKGIVRVTRETAAEFYFWLLIEQPERCNYLISKFLEEE
jgi:hypothetical protein